MGKKGGLASKAKNTQEEPPPENDGVKLTGVLSTDLALLCEHRKLPIITVKPLHPSPPATVEGSSGELCETELPTPSQFTVLADWSDPEDHASLHTLHMRGWLLSETVLAILTEALTSCSLLSVLNLWNVGLTTLTLQKVTALAIVHSIRELRLDGNTISPEPLIEFLKQKTSVEFLSLKCCALTDAFLTQISPSLADNHTLLHLDLSCNRLSDTGLVALATALRLNRTLLSLMLTNNNIGDHGVSALCEVLCEFPLNHDEVVRKRKMDSVQGKNEEGQEGAVSREVTGRSTSVASVDKRGGKTPAGKTGRKDAKRDDKGKKDDKGKRGADSKRSGRDKDSKASKKGGDLPEEVTPIEPIEVKSPLLDAIKSGDQWLLPGNTSLVYLGLTYNNISEVGLQSLLSTIQYQTTLTNPSTPGLLGVAVHHNSFPSSSKVLTQLLELITSKTSLSGDPAGGVEQDTLEQCKTGTS